MLQFQFYEANDHVQKDGAEAGRLEKLRIGENISRKEKYNFLLKTVSDHLFMKSHHEFC